MPAVSKHLKVLERAGLIARGRDAQWRPCRLEPAPLKDVAEWVGHYRRFWEQNLDRLDEYLRAIKPATGRRAARRTDRGAPRRLSPTRVIEPYDPAHRPPVRPALAGSSEGPGPHRDRDAGARHRRQRRHLQRRSRRAAAAAREPRRGSPDLHPSERAKGIGTENANFSVPEIQDLRAARPNR